MKNVKALIKFESLSVENINKAIRTADTFLAEQGIDSWERTRQRLLMQKILLKYNEIKTEVPFRIYTRRFYKRVAIMVAVKCEKFDPMEDADTIFSQELLSGMANPPRWSYRIGWNRLLYSTQTLMPGKEAIKRLIHYMGKESSSFKTAVFLRFVNMVLLLSPYGMKRKENFSAPEILSEFRPCTIVL